jgi:hypothetical protein
MSDTVYLVYGVLDTPLVFATRELATTYAKAVMDSLAGPTDILIEWKSDLGDTGYGHHSSIVPEVTVHGYSVRDTMPRIGDD